MFGRGIFSIPLPNIPLTHFCRFQIVGVSSRCGLATSRARSQVVRAGGKTRARSVLSGDNDLIAKPIRPTELCVKALAHLLKNRVAEQPVAK